MRKREIKRQEKDKKREQGEVVSDSISESDNSDSDMAANEQEFTSKDPKVRTAVRNLRQREDVAKYLRNLDPSSAHYDAKSRMMKDAPNPDLPSAL